MNNKLSKLLGLMSYFLVMGILLDFNWNSLIKPKPFILVIIGMLILTLSQYKKSFTKEDFVSSAKWNVLLAGFLATLMSLLSFVSAASISSVNIANLVAHILPLLYGSVIYLVLNLIYDSDRQAIEYEHEVSDKQKDASLINLPTSEQIFRDFGLTTRECHVAIKLLENISNKEIAAQLYISEATVKKHVQNIYQKLQASDRNSFKDIYISKAGYMTKTL